MMRTAPRRLSARPVIPALIAVLMVLAPLAAARLLIAPRAAASPALPARSTTPTAPASSSTIPDLHAAADPAPGDEAIARAWLQDQGPSLASGMAASGGSATLGQPAQVHRWSTGFLDGSAPEAPLPAAALWVAPVLVDDDPIGAIAVVVADSTAQGAPVEDELLAAALLETASPQASAPGSTQAPPTARTPSASPSPTSTGSASPSGAQGTVIVLGQSTDWYVVSGGQARAASHGAQEMLAGPISLDDYSAVILQRSHGTTPAPAVGSKGEDSVLSSDQQAEVAAAVGLGLLLIVMTVRRERRVLAPTRPPAKPRRWRTAEVARPDQAPKRGEGSAEDAKTPEMARTPEQP